MPITHEALWHVRRRVGKTRQRLADMITAAIPGIEIYPEDLIPQNPQYSRKESDCCSWTATCKMNGYEAMMHSWQPMGFIVKRGVGFSQESPFEIEVFAEEHETNLRAPLKR